MSWRSVFVITRRLRCNRTQIVNRTTSRVNTFVAHATNTIDPARRIQEHPWLIVGGRSARAMRSASPNVERDVNATASIPNTRRGQCITCRAGHLTEDKRNEPHRHL